MEQFADGTGTIDFGDISSLRGQNLGFWMPGLDNRKRFFRIRDPETVMRHILAMQR